MRGHSDFQVVDRDGRRMEIDHFLLDTCTPEQIRPFHCLADPNPDLNPFFSESLLCNTLLA